MLRNGMLYVWMPWALNRKMSKDSGGRIKISRTVFADCTLRHPYHNYTYALQLDMAYGALPRDVINNMVR